MQIDVTRIVAARPPVVFATMADVADWPRIIGSVIAVELLTPGPIRVGTRLRERRIRFGHETTEELEVADFEEPRRIRLVGDHHDFHYELDHVIDALAAGGSRLMLIFRSKAGSEAGRAIQPLIAPFADIELRDELERDLADLAAAVAAKSAPRRRGGRRY